MRVACVCVCVVVSEGGRDMGGFKREGGIIESVFE